MSNTNGGGRGSFRGEHVSSASYHTRPLATSSSGPASHHGVVVNTKEGNSYLIHHPGPGHVTTVTPASNMSKNWTKSHDIPVQGSKTVQEAVYKLNFLKNLSIEYPMNKLLHIRLFPYFSNHHLFIDLYDNSI